MTTDDRPVRQLYEALATGDQPTLDAILSADFEGLLAEGMPGGVGGAHHGAEAMRRDGWGGIGRLFAARAEPTEIVELQDGRLLVTGRYRGAGRHGGAPLDAAFAHVVTVSDGRITRLEQYTDTARWAAASPRLTALSCTVADGVATVRLRRPDQGNAIDDVMGRDFATVAEQIAVDDSVRAVLLTGSGPMFCAGGDIELFASTPPDRLPGRLRRMIDDYHLSIERFCLGDAPIVAAVHGSVGGGGLGLICLSDIVVASEEAVFALGYSGLGLTADGGNSWFLPRLLGLRRAQELLLLNRRFSAAEALAWGLVTTVVPAADVEQEAAAIAGRLAAGPTRALGATRRLLLQSFDTGLRDQLAAERDSIVDAASTADVQEGVRAFTERRRPRFTGH